MPAVVLKIALRLLLVAGLVLTVLIQYRKVTFGGLSVVVTSDPHGWILFTDDFGGSVFGGMRNYQEDDQLSTGIVFDKNLMRDKLHWFGLVSFQSSGLTAAVYHWMIWGPLLLINVAQWWWRQRAARARLQSSQGTPKETEAA
ncbi:MAG: hypothetical protein NXI04_04040 [Planctomycetaceae bacterium]|nr:hypothetical protein [Planctomycetaceae bacterium]